MRILFLNQYFPPDPAPTGIQLAELAQRLVASGHCTEFVSAGQEYRAAGGKQKHRIVREAGAILRILIKGLTARRPDIVFSASSPPCLLLVATVIALVRRAKSVHWLMDMYPELAVALGELRPGWIARWIASAMGWAYRRTHLVVGLDSDMTEHLERVYGTRAEAIHPWVSERTLADAKAADQTPDEMWTWIYSGNLGRAHEWETILRAQALLEARQLPIQLLFQGGGPSRVPARALASELALKNCEWRDYVDEHGLPRSLLRCRLLVVTQKPETQGLLWPSKLALAMNLPRPILWIGPAEGAVARLLRDIPEAGVFAPGQEESVADWVESRLNGEPVLPIMEGSAYRLASLERWERLLQNLVS